MEYAYPKKILQHGELLCWKISFFQKEAGLKNYLFWKSTFAEKVTVQENLMLLGSKCF